MPGKQRQVRFENGGGQGLAGTSSGRKWCGAGKGGCGTTGELGHAGWRVGLRYVIIFCASFHQICKYHLNFQLFWLRPETQEGGGADEAGWRTRTGGITRTGSTQEQEGGGGEWHYCSEAGLDNSVPSHGPLGGCSRCSGCCAVSVSSFRCSVTVGT